MNGKEYVMQAIEKAERVMSELESSGKLDGDPILKELNKACADLGQLKNKANLRTRAGANLAIPVFEAAERLEEAWEDAADSEDPDDVKEQIEAFVDATGVLGGALKERTVIMT